MPTTLPGAMPFLVFSRSGFDDVVARIGDGGAVLYLNPGVAQGADIGPLRERDVAVHILPRAFDPQVPGDVEEAARATGREREGLWVEHGATVPQADTARSEAARLEPGPAVAEGAPALHRRLARTAGQFASGALRRLRAEGVGRNLMVLPYHGFGNGQRIWVKGRVLDEFSYREQSEHDSSWSNLVALYRRLESDEVAHARVLAHFGGRTWETETDAGGYFAFEMVLEQAPGKGLAGGWHSVELELPEHQGPDGAPVRASAQVSIPNASARFGIISDIDDTVLWTNVTNKFNMALMLARSNHHTRKPFKGVAAFYRALNEGAGSNEDNPLFYVSSSPWHLFGPLVDFLRVQSIPLGPLLLRELKVRDLLSSNHNHKLDKIELIMSFYPDMQFVLIGDSGEQDPEIYTEIVRRHPTSVRMIYIRNVNPDPARIDALDRLIEEVSSTGTQLILCPDSVFAASHAAAEGLIRVDRLGLVRSDKREDDSAPSPA
ncbi:App1 family protein [Massilia niabensis]|uniref:App1 family protein n=1 Tax=Massilia niabensis TaxID=544910 RepID=A0ABW0LDZ0_9BURK